MNYTHVIPGELAIASATRNPELKNLWIPAFAGMTPRLTCFEMFRQIVVAKIENEKSIWTWLEE